MRAFTTKAWTNTTISIYAATVGNETWMRLDNVSLRRTPGAAIGGADCVEPSAAGPGAIEASGTSSAQQDVPAASGPMDAAATGWQPTVGWSLAATSVTGGAGQVWVAEAHATGRDTLLWARPIDLREATDARLHFRSSLTSRASTASVQVSLDGVTWQSLTAVPAGDGVLIDVDLSAFAGQIVWLRFVFDAVAPPTPGGLPDVWVIDAVEVDGAASPSTA